MGILRSRRSSDSLKGMSAKASLRLLEEGPKWWARGAQQLVRADLGPFDPEKVGQPEAGRLHRIQMAVVTMVTCSLS